MSKKLSLVVSLAIAVSLGCSPAPSDVSTAPDANSSGQEIDAALQAPVVQLRPDFAIETRDHSIDATSQVPLAAADTSRPDAVVGAFLDALRDGNDAIAEALLTTIARRETQKHDLPVQAPGSPSARYQIGEVKHVQGGVHVNSIWSEVDPEGEQSVFEIVWVLRQEPIGWRVAGMATAVNPAKPPIFLNFEDVPDLLQKWRLADAELAAQEAAAQALQASQSANTLQR